MFGYIKSSSAALFAAFLCAVSSAAMAQDRIVTVPLVRQDFSDCGNNDVTASDASRVGGSATIKRLPDSTGVVDVSITRGTPNTSYHFFLKCIRFMGDIRTDGSGVGQGSFPLGGGEGGDTMTFDMYPEGAPLGNKFQSVRKSLPSALSADPSVTVQNGLVAYYSFEVDADDDGPNGYRGAQSLAVYYGKGTMGQAAYFTQPGAFVKLPPMPRYAPSYSISGWIDMRSLQGPSGESNGAGVAFGGVTIERGTGRVRFVFPYDSASKQDGLSATYPSNRALGTGQWTHVAVVFDGGANKLTLYVNGTADATAAPPANVRSVLPVAPGVGGDPANSTGATVLNGAVDSVAIHNRAINADEVRFLASFTDVPGTGAAAFKVLGGTITTQGSACGDYWQGGCRVCTRRFGPGLQWGQCAEWTQSCNDPYVFDTFNQKCVCPLGTYHPHGLGFTTQTQGTCTAGTAPPKATIAVTDLPSPLDIPGVPRLIQNLAGKRVVVSSAPYATYSVPDGRAQAPSCARVQSYSQWACQQGLASCNALRGASSSCATNRPLCSSLGVTDRNGKALNFPLYTLMEWNNLKPGGLKINANWFDILSDAPNFPHTSPCTDIYGLSQSGSTVISQASNGDPQNADGTNTNLLDALMISRVSLPDGSSHHRIQVVKNSDIASVTDVEQAVGGFILVKSGVTVNTFSSSTKPDRTGPRTAVGISQDGNTLYIVVVQPGFNTPGLTAKEMALYMKSLGSWDVINLDNSGSSQLFYDAGTGGPPVTTLPGDQDAADQPAQRPVANYLEVRAN